MQSLGFAYAIEPVLKKLYPDRTEYEARLRLHLDYFNTQPYLASFILGAVVRMEQDRAAGKETGTDVQDLKTSLMAPLGALGDSFFWGSLKPFAVVIHGRAGPGRFVVGSAALFVDLQHRACRAQGGCAGAGVQKRRRRR